ncbi:hypothetical protein KAI04_01385 [Candidatus Pacearchaeota archaeon]|nr:hypothetical protein [Candidatus Pacearchaeota archaeon]
MGLFKKEKKSVEKKEIPQLPELPKLPELAKIEEKGLYSQSVNQLPKFPNNSFGEKFSQNTIKEAVAGDKEGEEDFDADDFADNMQMMQKPLKKQFTQKISPGFQEASTKTKKAEPVFIRLDKFEESLNLFKKAKKQISEIETMLNNIKKLKEQEEKELEFWEKEMQSIKTQIEKVDKDIFSKIE